MPLSSSDGGYARSQRDSSGKIVFGLRVLDRSYNVGIELQRRLFTADEYHRMAQAGVLGEDDRVELLDGEIVEMTPIGSPHAACVDRLNVLLQQAVAGRGIVRVQGPIRLDAHSEPQPDLSILKPRSDFYSAAHPTPPDVLLVVEVADSSVTYDRGLKVPLYARAAITETWLVDLPNECVEIFSQPSPHGYQASRRAMRGERLASHVLPNMNLSVDEILGESTRRV